MISPKSRTPNRPIANRPLPKAPNPQAKRMTKRRWLVLTVAVLFGGGKQGGDQSGQAKGSPGWPGPQSTDGQRNAFRNQMLSSIPADSRAQFQNYRQFMQARAIQRGINSPWGGPH